MTNIHTSKKLTATNGAAKSCRLLGLPGDAQTNFTFPHANNACYAVDPACPVRSEHQLSHCLSAAHHDCHLYRSYHGLEGGNQSLSEAELQAILNLDSPPRARLWSILGFAAVLVLVALALVFSGDILASLASGPPAQQAVIEPASPTALLTPMAAGTQTAQPLFLPLVPDSSEATATPQATSSSPLPSPPSSQATSSSPPPTLPSSQATSSSPLPSSPSPASSCGPPAGWVQYTVHSGDSLYGLSVAVGASLDQLREANCLVVGGLIYTGQRLYLPRLPVATATPSRAPTDLPDPTDPPPPTETELPAATGTEAPPTATQPPPTATPPPPTETAVPEPPTSTPPPTRMPTPTFAPTPTPILNTSVP